MWRGEADVSGSKASQRWMDLLDAASKIAGVLTTVILGWLTVSLTWNDQLKRSEQATADTVLKVVELSVAKDDATKNIGLTMIDAMQRDGMGGLLDQAVVGQSGFQILLSKLTDTISAGGAAAQVAPSPAAGERPAASPLIGELIRPAEPREGTPTSSAPTPVAPTSAAPSAEAAKPEAAAAESWVYLGTWDAAAAKWTSRYLAFDAKLPPDALQGKRFEVPRRTGAIYVRSGPSSATTLAPILDTLPAGKSVRIEQVSGGSSDAHKWARVTY